MLEMSNESTYEMLKITEGKKSNFIGRSTGLETNQVSQLTLKKFLYSSGHISLKIKCCHINRNKKKVTIFPADVKP